jgi:hypothetical protein
MTYSKAQLKSSGDKASPSLLDMKIIRQIFTYTYTFHLNILMSLTSFMGTPNSMRILYNTSLLTETGFLEVYKYLMYCLIHTYISHFISPKYNGHETGHRHNTNKQSIVLSLFLEYMMNAENLISS